MGGSTSPGKGLGEGNPVGGSKSPSKGGGERNPVGGSTSPGKCVGRETLWAVPHPQVRV